MNNVGLRSYLLSALFIIHGFCNVGGKNLNSITIDFRPGRE